MTKIDYTARDYKEGKTPTYAMGERTLISQERGQLHLAHRETAKGVSEILGEKLDQSEYRQKKTAINRLTNDAHARTRATMMTGIENSIQQELQKRNAKLVNEKRPPMTQARMEQIQNNVMKSSTGKFKGKTLGQRLTVSKNLANARIKKELQNSTTKENAEKSRNRAINFLTDNREGGRSLQGGSNYKFEERILVAEMNRARQETTREIMSEFDLLGRWVLSARHNIFDICDKFATETGRKAERLIRMYNLPIFQEGVYTNDEMPDYPHPFCQCEIDIVDVDLGMATIGRKEILDNLGDNMIPYNEGMMSEESQEYYREWQKREYKLVKPYDYTRRTQEEVLAELEKIDKKTDPVNGTVEYKNKALDKYIRRGGANAYQEVSRNTLGYSLDPEVVDKIGVDNAMKLLAHDLKKQGKADITIKALEEYNEKRLPLQMKKSLAEARKHMNEADSYRLQVSRGTPKRSVQGLRTKALMNARQELGDAIGYGEMHTRLLKELKSNKPIEYLNIPYKSNKSLTSLSKILDLEGRDFKKMTSNKVKYMSLGESGIEKLSKHYGDKSAGTLSSTLERIRKGRANKKDWIPAMFKETYTDKSTGKENPFRLRDDQQTGIRFVKESKSAMFHYKPGAGKTHTAMGSITELYAEGKIKKSLVVVPNNLVRQFQDEIKEFTTESVTVRAMTYQSKAKRLEEYAGQQMITVISHNQLRNDQDALRKAGFDMVVVDEVHQLTKTMFQALNKMDSEYRIAMTGTAIKESVTDMYDVVNWLSPEGIGAKYKFDNKFKDITKASSFYQESVLRDLRDTLKPYVLTKDSPVEAKLNMITRNIKMSTEQLEKINKAEKKAIQSLDRGTKRVTVNAKKERELEEVVNGGSPKDNAKIKELDKIFKRHKDEKVIIFASKKSSMGTLKEYYGEKADYFDNSITKAQQSKMIRDFRADPDKRILVLTDAGATGLNLEVSNVAVHWDIPDKHYKLEQRVARNWRGMKTDTTYQYLLQTNTTYDSRIIESLRKSQMVSESAKVAETMDEQGVGKVLDKMLRRGK